MQVPFLDLRRAGPELDTALTAAFERVLKSGRYIMGPEVDAFEAKCAAFIGVKHAIGVSSGTDALLAVLMALEIGPGDEVIVPTYTFFATAGVVWRLGATPIFVDVDPRDFNVTAKNIAAALTERTKAIVPVHLFGQCADISAIEAVAGGIPVIEDAAQAIGSELRGTMAGALGLAGCFSFFPAKNLGALGDAGLITTNDDALAERIRRLRAHGSKPKYHHAIVGGNFRIDALQAALLNVKLDRLHEATERRRANARFYGEALTPYAGLAPTESADRRHVYNQYVIQTGERDRVQAHLRDRGVATAVYYPRPLHQQPCFASLEPGPLPVSERLARETLALPIFPELTSAERSHVAQVLREALGAPA